MNTCLIPFTLNNLTHKQDILYRIVPKKIIYCDIDKNKLTDIIHFTFTQKRDLSVFGYNTDSEEFYAKKIIKKEFLLYITLLIKSVSSEKSSIIITPIIGNDTEIKHIILIIENMINLYKRFNFITNL